MKYTIVVLMLCGFAAYTFGAVVKREAETVEDNGTYKASDEGAYVPGDEGAYVPDDEGAYKDEPIEGSETNYYTGLRVTYPYGVYPYSYYHGIHGYHGVPLLRYRRGVGYGIGYGIGTSQSVGIGPGYIGAYQHSYGI